MTNDLQLSDFQKEVLSIPEEWDLALLGGRGSGKSYLMAWLIFRHVEQYGDKARCLLIRKTHKSLADIEHLTREMFGTIYGGRASYNSTEGFWKFPNGGYVELNQLQNDVDYLKYQGRTFSALFADEITQYSTPRLVDKLRSNLRGPKGMPIRMVVSGNPGGNGHGWVSKRYINNGVKDFTPFTEPDSGRTFVTCKSTYKDNPFIDQAQYRQNLLASTAHDPELGKAWLSGDWSIARGSFFTSVLSHKRNEVGPFESVPVNPYNGKKWRHWLAHDYGSSAPSVTYLMVESPGQETGEVYYPKDSIIILGELATNHPNDYNEGMGYTIPHLAELITELCDKWGVRADGVADDACFAEHGHSSGSIANEFKKEGISFRKAHKGSRKSGWEKMRTMLQNAGEPDRPGLYISKSCRYFWNTVPYLSRDPRNPEDVDTNDFDHGADACRYGLSHERMMVGVTRLKGF